MNEYSKEDIKKLNVRVESKYDIFTDENDELCFALAKVEGPQEKPVLYYAGADHAIFVKNKLTEELKNAGENTEQRENEEKHDELGYRNGGDGKIYKVTGEDGTEDEWTPHDAMQGLEESNIDGFYDFGDCKGFTYSGGWIYFVRRYEYELLPDGHYAHESIFCYNMTIYKMQPDGTYIEELYTLCDVENDFMRLHITEVKDSWIYFTEELSGCYSMEFKISTDGREKQLCSPMSRIQLSAVAYSMQGAMFEKDGEYYDAARQHMTAFLILTRMVDIAHAENEPKYAESVRALINCYDLSMQYKTGADLLERVLRVYENLTFFGSEYEANEALFHAHLAYFYTKLEKYEEAEEVCKTALYICRSHIEKNPQTYNEIYANSLFSMAELLHDTKRYDEAEPIYRERIKLCEQLAAEKLDNYDIYLATSINNLGSMYREMGRYSECEPLYDRALAMHRKIVSENPGNDGRKNELAARLFRMGLLYELTDRAAQAKEAWEEAYEIWSGMDKKNIDYYYTAIFNQVKEKLGKEI